MEYEVIGDVACGLGEGALWHPVEHCLYWVDIDQGKLYRYKPAGGRCELVVSGRPIGGLTYQADGSLLLLRDRGRVETWREGRLAGVVIDAIPAESGTRFNDCIADPRGRVYCGTMEPDGRGRLYRIDTDGSYCVLLDDVACATAWVSRPTAGSFISRNLWPARSGCSTTMRPRANSAAGGRSSVAPRPPCPTE